MAEHSDNQECGVCMNKFDRKKHAARLLPCMHVLCTYCLRRIKDDQGLIQCPFDRETFTVPENDVCEFPLKSQRRISASRRSRFGPRRLFRRAPRAPPVVQRETGTSHVITSDDFMDERNVSEEAIWDYEDRMRRRESHQTSRSEPSNEFSLPPIPAANSPRLGHQAMFGRFRGQFNSNRLRTSRRRRNSDDLSVWGETSDDSDISSRSSPMSLPDIRDNVQRVVNKAKNFLSNVKMALRHAID